MSRYSQERKDAVLSKLSPPLNMSVAEVARTEGISVQTLYNWRKQARLQGQPVPGNKSNSEQWSAQAKLAVVIETSSLSEAELSEYCRSKGLHVEQVKAWKADALHGFVSIKDQEKAAKKKQRADRKEIKRLQRDLDQKEKALAETAALLVLRKKLDAFWENNNEDD